MKLIEVNDFLKALDEMWNKQKGFCFEDIKNVAILHTPRSNVLQQIREKVQKRRDEFYENTDVWDELNRIIKTIDEYT